MALSWWYLLQFVCEQGYGWCDGNASICSPWLHAQGLYLFYRGEARRALTFPGIHQDYFLYRAEEDGKWGMRMMWLHSEAASGVKALWRGGYRGEEANVILTGWGECLRGPGEGARTGGGPHGRRCNWCRRRPLYTGRHSLVDPKLPYPSPLLFFLLFRPSAPLFYLGLTLNPPSRSFYTTKALCPLRTLYTPDSR